METKRLKSSLISSSFRKRQHGIKIRVFHTGEATYSMGLLEPERLLSLWQSLVSSSLTSATSTSLARWTMMNSTDFSTPLPGVQSFFLKMSTVSSWDVLKLAVNAREEAYLSPASSTLLTESDLKKAESCS
jgi:hypothetical protein